MTKGDSAATDSLQVLWEEEENRFHLLRSARAGEHGEYIVTAPDFGGLMFREELAEDSDCDLVRGKDGKITVSKTSDR